MKTTAQIVLLGLVMGGTAAVPAARADVTGSFDGNLSAKQLAAPTAAAGVLSQTGKTLTGTLALPPNLVTFGGAYIVQGTVTPRHLKVRGAGPGGIVVNWVARIKGGTVQGKAKFKGGGAKLVAVLTLTRNVSTGDGSACDAVYTQNQAFFVDQVLGQALTVCQTCHAPGLQAGATRLHVTPSDPLATARAIALLIDAADPTSSRILLKPTNVLPHGGGLQIVPGSPQDNVLQLWVALVAQAHCS